MTFGAIKSRIADELVRPDLASQIALAVNDAISEAATTRFWFNEVRGLTFALNPGQSFYGQADDPDIPGISRIDSLWLISSGQRFNLDVANALDVEGWNQGTNTIFGQPGYYTRQGNGLLFWMIPDQTYQVSIDGTTRFSTLSADSDDNPYLNEGERYVRALAKAMVTEDVIRDFDEADRLWARAQREKTILMGETGSRLASNTNAACL